MGEEFVLPSAQGVLDAFPDPHLMFRPIRNEVGHIVDFEFVAANKAACEFAGVSREAIIGKRARETYPDDGDTMTALYAHAFETGEPVLLEDVLLKQVADEERYFDITVARVDDVLSYTVRDVTARHRALNDLRERESEYRLLAENAMDLVVSTDATGVVTWLSPSVERELGYDPAELRGRRLSELVDVQDHGAVEHWKTTALSGRSPAIRIRLHSKQGDPVWMEATPRRITDQAGNESGSVIGLRNVDREVAVESALEHELRFDGLTGLAKRAIAIQSIEEILQTRDSAWWAVLCVGIDGMTAINHAFTYSAGDQVLRTVAERLVAAAGAHDRVARSAGDEFIVMLRDIENPTDAANAAERIMAAVRGPIQIAGHEVDISVSVGIAPAAFGSGATLVRDASAAMRQSYRHGPGHWEFLDGNAGAAARESLAVQAAVREALREGQIQPWYMPIAALHDHSIVGYEALARWVKPDGSVATPDSFVRVAESTDLIVVLDRNILSHVLETLSTIKASRHVAVNVSALTLTGAGFVDWLRSEFARTGADPARVHLEVTETALLEVTAGVIEVMRDLAAEGVRWWVDDFGTGYSSISHLRDMPIAGLKLDRSFTAALAEDDGRVARLARGLLGLAQGLGLKTVAEGVETPAEAELLATLGWRWGQGWLFGKPAPVPVP